MAEAPKDAPKASDQQISEAQRTSNALAEAAKLADERKMDETVEGGKFMVGDRFVDAEGNEIREKKD